MAKLTDKSAIVTLSLSDLLHVVDVDDLTSDPLGTSKKASISQIVALAGGAPTHTGEVTGATVLTVDKTAITNKTTVTGVTGDFVLISDTSDAGNLKKVDVVDFLGGAADGNGIYSGSGTLTANTTVTNAGFDLSITGTGNFGIGTTTPSEKLEVVGAAKIAGANDTEIGGVAVSGRMKIVGGLTFMQIQNASLASIIANHAMTQDGVGNTTLNAAATKFLYLRVGNANQTGIQIEPTLIKNKVSTEFENYVRVTGDGAAMALGQTTDINTAFLVKSNRTTILNIGSVSTTFLSMLSSGNVGIGTATPTDTLQVVGNLNATRYKVNGVAGANFTGAVTNITVVDGLVTIVS